MGVLAIPIIFAFLPYPLHNPYFFSYILIGYFYYYYPIPSIIVLKLFFIFKSELLIIKFVNKKLFFLILIKII